ncbi:MAG: hypothetical protein AABZ32_01510, partial [Bacteroidota bacterium]
MVELIREKRTAISDTKKFPDVYTYIKDIPEGTERDRMITVFLKARGINENSEEYTAEVSEWLEITIKDEEIMTAVNESAAGEDATKQLANLSAKTPDTIALQLVNSLSGKSIALPQDTREFLLIDEEKVKTKLTEDTSFRNEVLTTRVTPIYDKIKIDLMNETPAGREKLAEVEKQRKIAAFKERLTHIKDDFAEGTEFAKIFTVSEENDQTRQEWVKAGPNYDSDKFITWYLEKIGVEKATADAVFKDGQSRVENLPAKIYIRDTVLGLTHIRTTLLYDFVMTQEKVKNDLENAKEKQIIEWLDPNSQTYPEALNVESYLAWANKEYFRTDQRTEILPNANTYKIERNERVEKIKAFLITHIKKE